ncbi:MAG: BlaI/MecI/CopY family transcriptional regulator [Ruminococcus sp.]|nr:BlaI/MecI/CopY family transcriptional regulator [Ruminococcus sp.]
MTEKRLGVIETRFANLIWENEPLATSQLIKMCEEEFSWKRTTTYTVLKRLSERGLFENKDGTVSSLVSRDDYYATQSESFIEESFGGSLPAFLTAFTSKNRLSKKDVEKIKKMIKDYEEQ